MRIIWDDVESVFIGVPGRLGAVSNISSVSLSCTGAAAGFLMFSRIWSELGGKKWRPEVMNGDLIEGIKFAEMNFLTLYATTTTVQLQHFK